MELTKRQEAILEIVKNNGPITSEQIADKLSLTRATLRPDLAILTMSGLLEARPRVGYFYSGKSPDRIVAQKLRRVQVGKVHSHPVVVKDDTPVHDAIVGMFLEDCGTLFVVDENSFLQGVVSRKDLLRLSIGGYQDLHKLPVGVVMTRMPNVITTNTEESLWDAAKKLVAHEVDALPVVSSANTASGVRGIKVVGRLSKTNITRYFVELGESL